MTYKNIQNLISYSENGILSKIILKNQESQVTLFCMASGTDISEHTSTKQGYVHVIEGKGIFNLEMNDIKMLAGVIIRLEKNAKHSLIAEENTSFLLILSN